ncbi:hypothetical protein K435DRAFT_810585 [Dendrothele bispora CBS 962.96]|uniref:Uncharacterized protein n=1 Tax=Dendrothele bispora (strain CBS 962.96) TaxID=1314807 RepID=A0A4S8KV27_DENBC|nr:hypothetical protein K435DRAFT_810585 [Dendrothele bispora CBS 962.96]
MRFIITVALSLAAFISFAVASPVVTPLEAEAGLVQKRQCTPQGGYSVMALKLLFVPSVTMALQVVALDVAASWWLVASYELRVCDSNSNTVELLPQTLLVQLPPTLGAPAVSVQDKWIDKTFD